VSHSDDASRLGDLPHAGYSTTRQKQTSDLVMFWLREIERNRFLLLSIVVDGWDKWRKIAGKAWDVNRGGRSTAMGTDLLKLVWEYMVKLAGDNPASQLLILEGMKRREALHWDFRKATAQALVKAQIDAQIDLEREQRSPRKFYLS
jgi:hypothetical protein